MPATSRRRCVSKSGRQSVLPLLSSCCWTTRVLGSPVRLAVPSTCPRSTTATVPVELGDSNSNGVIIAQGGRFGGGTLYRKGGKLHHEYNFFGVERTNIADGSALSAGKHVIKYQFVPDAPRPGTGGNGMLFVDGKQLAQNTFPGRCRSFSGGDEGADVG